MTPTHLDDQIIQWLRSVDDALQKSMQSETPHLYLEAAESLDGQPVERAICAHLEWRDRLEALLDRPESTALDPIVVGQDHHCAIGRWLQTGATDAVRALPEFTALRGRHAAFHAYVGELVADLRNGHPEIACGKLHSVEYTQYSWDVVQAIAALARALASRGPQANTGCRTTANEPV